MHIERATEDIYIFTSDRYAQVTASLIVSGNTGILIDAMPYPEEAAQIALLAHRRCPDGECIVGDQRRTSKFYSQPRYFIICAMAAHSLAHVRQALAQVANCLSSGNFSQAAAHSSQHLEQQVDMVPAKALCRAQRVEQHLQQSAQSTHAFMHLK